MYMPPRAHWEQLEQHDGVDLGGVHMVLVIEEREAGVSSNAIDGADEPVADACLLVTGGVKHPVPSKQQAAPRDASKSMLVVRNTSQWGLPTLRTTISCSAAGAKGSILSVDRVSTQSCCASTIAPPGAAAPSSLDSAAPAIRWDTGVRGTGVGSIVCPGVQLLAVCGRDEP